MARHRHPPQFAFRATSLGGVPVSRFRVAIFLCFSAWLRLRRLSASGEVIDQGTGCTGPKPVAVSNRPDK